MKLSPGAPKDKIIWRCSSSLVHVCWAPLGWSGERVLTVTLEYGQPLLPFYEMTSQAPNEVLRYWRGLPKVVIATESFRGQEKVILGPTARAAG